MLGWRRVRVVLGVCLVLSLLFLNDWHGSLATLYGRLFFVGLIGLVAFGVLERWPARLPRRLARWVLQVVGVTLAVPLAVTVAYLASTRGDPTPFWRDPDRMLGFEWMMVLGVLFAPWMAVSALVRQITGDARNQALAFELERSELERKALDARMRLLQARARAARRCGDSRVRRARGRCRRWWPARTATLDQHTVEVVAKP